MNKGAWKYRTIIAALIIGYAVPPAFGAVALPLDTALTVPKEDGFDALEIAGVTNVVLYNQLPESWKVTELTGTWRKKKLDQTNGPAIALTAVELEAAVQELFGANPPTNAVWQEGSNAGFAMQKDRTLFMSQFTLTGAPDPEQQVCRLVFDYVDKCDLYVNGKKAASYTAGHWGIWMPWEVEISSNVTAGRNVIALSFPTGGTIAGEFRVAVGSPVYAKRLLINPDIRKNEVNARMILQSNRSKPFTTTLRAEINTWKEKPVLATEAKEVTINPGENWVTLSVKLSDPVYWSPENPHLYEIRLFDKDGLCYGKERFGFREFVAKGRHFYLNGNPVRLFGMQWSQDQVYPSYLAPVKSGEGKLTLGKRYHTAYLKGFKWAGLNTTRPVPAGHGRDMYEACDELGILNNEEADTSHVIFEATPGPIEEHMAKEFAAREAWLYYGYNHPSTAMYNFGNERYGALSRNLDALYYHLKPLDEQNRPMCSSSGRIPWALNSGIRDRIDFGDDHSYFGTMRGSWLFNREYFASLKQRCDAMYGPDTVPLVNYELGGGFLPRYENDGMWAQINAVVTASPVDRAAYCKMATQAGEWGWEVVARLVLLQRGLRVTATDEKEVHLFAAENMRRIWELIRQQDVLEGVGPHQAGNFLMYGEKQPKSLGAATNRFPKMTIKSAVIDRTRKEFIKTPALYAMKRAYSLEVIQARWFDRNLIAGLGAIDTAIFAINDTMETHDYTARVLFKNAAGKVLQGDTLAFGNLGPSAEDGGQRPPLQMDQRASGDSVAAISDRRSSHLKSIEYRLPIAAKLATGSYWLEMFLFRDGQRVGDNRYEVLVFAPGDVVAPVKTDKKVALYGGTGGTADVLKALDVKFDAIRDLKDLGRYAVLIIGGNAMDETIIRGGEAIRQWIEAGGRLLCFDQKQTGVIPWATGLSLISSEASEVSDIVEPAHPAFAGLEQRWFDTWSGKGTLYDNTLSPLNDAAIAIAPNGYVMSSKFVGTVMADVAIGKGLSLISAYTVTERFGKDAVATRLAQNLVRFIVSDETRFSLPVKSGRPVLMLRAEDCDLLDLKLYFNSSFMDEEANDGKGGWDDYGPNNDLRNMVVGNQLLAGVPFMVVDPRTNNDRSCIILQCPARWPRLPKSVSIKVGGLYNALYFLHTSTYTVAKNGDALSSFVIRFEDGTQDELVIRNGVHVTDWFGPSNDLPGSVLAWTGMAANRMAGVYLTEWRNPKPAMRIASIEFAGTGKNVAVLMAITGFKGSLERGWLSPEHTHSK